MCTRHPPRTTWIHTTYAFILLYLLWAIIFLWSVSKFLLTLKCNKYNKCEKYMEIEFRDIFCKNVFPARKQMTNSVMEYVIYQKMRFDMALFRFMKTKLTLSCVVAIYCWSNSLILFFFLLFVNRVLILWVLQILYTSFSFFHSSIS